jgi:F-type H+-transporting ATPase subunit epsilon
MRFFLKILTPEATLLQDHVDSVRVPAMDGAYELLFNHAPVFIALTSGKVLVTQAGEIEEWSIDGGTCHMQDNMCTVMVTRIVE